MDTHKEKRFGPVNVCASTNINQPDIWVHIFFAWKKSSQTKRKILQIIPSPPSQLLKG